jgi:hypothetical protein
MDEVCNDRQLEAYDSETMDPKAKWEQEQLHELERVAILEQRELMKDYFEELNQIGEFENWQEEEQQL